MSASPLKLRRQHGRAHAIALGRHRTVEEPRELVKAESLLQFGLYGLPLWHGWVDGWMDVWVDGWMDGWMSLNGRLSLSHRFSREARLNMKYHTTVAETNHSRQETHRILWVTNKDVSRIRLEFIEATRQTIKLV